MQTLAKWTTHLGGAVAVIALVSPGVVLAFASVNMGGGSALPFGKFTPAGVDRELAEQFDINTLAVDQRFEFTTAGVDKQAGSATIVVRADRAPTVGAVSLRKALEASEKNELSNASAHERPKLIASSYTLGAAKGLDSFTLPGKTSRGADDPILTDLVKGKNFKLDKNSLDSSGKLRPSIAFEDGRPITAAPRPVSGEKDYKVDLGGRYAIGRDVDVTAGVRLEGENGRNQRLTDDQRDSQAVYVGTQFRF